MHSTRLRLFVGCLALITCLSTLSACTFAELTNQNKVYPKVHLTAAANTTLGSDLSPSVELGLYSIYDRYAYKGTKLFDFAEQILVGYQNGLSEPAPKILTSYSNNVGLLGVGVYHDIELTGAERQRLGGRLMFFGPTHATTLPHLFFEVIGYVGGMWSLEDGSAEGQLGLGARLHYQVSDDGVSRRERRVQPRRPPPPPIPLTPEGAHHHRMWHIKEIRAFMDQNGARDDMTEELEELEREEEAYQRALKAGE